MNGFAGLNNASRQPGDAFSIRQKPVLDLAFGEGWALFFPLLLCYLGAWATGLSLPPFWVPFFAVQSILLAVCLVFWGRKFLTVDREERVFYGLVLVVCFLPGAFLEYPTDPWEHFRRIVNWSQMEKVGQYGYPFKFAYFWDWVFLGRVPFSWRYSMLDALSGFWLSLLAFHFYAFIRDLGVSRSWAKLHVAGFFFLFGITAFNFRYYALSTTPLAYVAYLRAARLVLSSQARRLPGLLFFSALVALVTLNHFQELAFICLTTAVVLGVRRYERAGQDQQNQFRRFATIFAVGGLAAGFLLRPSMAHSLKETGAGFLTRWGSFRVWDTSLSYFEAMAVPGVLSLILSVGIFSRRRLLNALNLAPLTALLFPPAAWAICFFSRDYNDPYRIFYAFPLSSGLISSLELLLDRLPKRKALAFASVAVLLLALPARFPMRGKLFFHFTRPERTMIEVVPAAEWIHENRQYPPNCWIVSDDATVMALQVHLGRDFVGPGHRIIPNLYAQRMSVRSDFSSIVRQKPFCAFLVPDFDKIPFSPSSKMAKLSFHWHERIGDPRWLTSEKYVVAANHWLGAWGWRKTRVPPHFTLYEPPTDGCWVKAEDGSCEFRN